MLKLVFRRATNPSVIDLLRPVIIPDEDVNTEDYLAMVGGALLNMSSNIRLWYAYDAGTNEVLAYFIVVWQPPTKYTFISQAWVKNAEVGSLIVPNVWAKIQAWTESLGLESIRAETWRGDAIIRKYKFKEVSRTVEYRIPHLDTTEEIINGQDEVNTEVSQHTDEGTEVDSGRLPVPVLSTGSGSGSDTLSGDARPGIDPTVRSDLGDDWTVESRDGAGEATERGSGQSTVGEGSAGSGLVAG
jgi:hypothetical protein